MSVLLSAKLRCGQAAGTPGKGLKVNKSKVGKSRVHFTVFYLFFLMCFYLLTHPISLVLEPSDHLFQKLVDWGTLKFMW